jgi:hypothetical protein
VSEVRLLVVGLHAVDGQSAHCLEEVSEVSDNLCSLLQGLLQDHCLNVSLS